jgi:hypothetical protein
LAVVDQRLTARRGLLLDVVDASLSDALRVEHDRADRHPLQPLFRFGTVNAA